jgi:hypothetical protein
MNRRLFATALLFAAGTLVAADKPNFTGEWKLNIEKSTFGPMPAPVSQMLKIEHDDPKMVIVQDQEQADGQKLNMTMKYSTDGTESTNDFRGAPAKMSAKWDGDALVVNTKLDFQGMEIKIANTMKLAADGKSITSVAKIETPQGDIETTSLLEKVQK